MLKLFNTFSKKIEIFKPINPERVTMYVCGPTVYNHPHIGNARPAVIFDILFKILKDIYPEVIYARNITDVDDKINDAAKKNKENISNLTQRYSTAYEEDMKNLGIIQPTFIPKVTDNISSIIDMISKLVELNHAYVANNHVLFDVESFPKYGEISKLKQKDLISGARIEVAPYKKNSSDFVLWKPSDNDTPGWSSPWGRGRPGWHIECSAMIKKFLGNSIDIHGGGQDLIFPHHENENAQSTCANNSILAKYWIHNGFVTFNKKKMSKSLDNIIILNDLKNKYRGESIRFALLSAHYRQPLDWNDTTMMNAENSLNNLYSILLNNVDIKPKISRQTNVEKNLLNDINTPEAIASLYSTARDLQKAKKNSLKSEIKGILLRESYFLGILQKEPNEWLQKSDLLSLTDKEINNLIRQRSLARKNKNFQEADRIRKNLLDNGISIKDEKDETRWTR
ncbi:MAG: cysteine--tRNA ligase [Rhodospirillaceae bacterium]|nr:cysteine--tRNA ligase [Rhodospirillaceae bacterium]|tara:strand:+ start:1971 stop:3332 length:1362 start_codon:yes stop_codon:yes gene_type:complete